MAAPDVAQRDANLEALKEALNKYKDVEISRLDNETKFLRSILQGRNARDAAALNLAEGSRLVQSAISDFLKTA
jgi:hypothetical protein